MHVPVAGAAVAPVRKQQNDLSECVDNTTKACFGEYGNYLWRARRNRACMLDTSSLLCRSLLDFSFPILEGSNFRFPLV